MSRPRVRVRARRSPAVSASGLRAQSPAQSRRPLATDPTVTDHERIAAGEDRSLYDVGFSGAFDGLFEAVADRGGTVLGATGGEAAWTVRLRVARREDVRGIHARLTEREFDCEVLRLSDPTAEGGPSGLTDEQHEALVAGVEGGYFEIHRWALLAELAQEFGITHQALSERFRRAYRTLVSSRLAGDAAATTA